MPILENKLGEAAPKEGHIAWVKTMDGEAEAFGPGMFAFIVPDPTRMDKAIPVILEKVTRDVIQFMCGCNQPGCTRRLSYKLRVAGHHPQPSK